MTICVLLSLPFRLLTLMSTSSAVKSLESTVRTTCEKARASMSPRLRTPPPSGVVDPSLSIDSGEALGGIRKEVTESESTPVKTPRKRKAKVVEPIVYVIPPVKRLETTYK